MEYLNVTREPSPCHIWGGLALDIYVFDDTDYFGKEEYDIQGDDYGIFLSVCYKYCASVSFCFRKTNELTIRWDDRMEEYRIPTTQNVLSVYSHYGIDRYSFLNDYYEIRHYAL